MLPVFIIPKFEYQCHLNREVSNKENWTLNHSQLWISMFANFYNIRNCLNTLHAGKNYFDYIG